MFSIACVNGQAGLVRINLCCLDGRVANGGGLAACGWDGEL